MTDPVQAEVEGVPQIVTWEGVDVLVPASVDDWDMDALEAFENGKGANFIIELVGRETYRKMGAAFKEHNGRKPKVSDFASFSEQVAKIYGFGSAGE